MSNCIGKQKSNCSGFRISFVYGDADWMDCRPVIDIIREFRFMANVNAGGKIIRLPNCGHQIMIDNPSALVDSICFFENTVDTKKDATQC